MEVMANVIEGLVNFATETKFEDLPGDVVQETKRILLDSIGSALGGLNIDKGKIAVQLARQLNGSATASIVGTANKVSYLEAAFANGELIQALDYDAVIFPAIHVTPFVLAAPLAFAEGLHSSGKELIRAIAIALEISTKFGKAFPKSGQIVGGKVVPLPVKGYNWTIFGGTAASGVLLGLNLEKMSQALGIAGLIAPVNARQKFMTTVPVTMSKHLMAGWMCAAEVTSVLLSDMGYVGDTKVFEGDYGFPRFCGYTRWEPTAVTEELGKSWEFVKGTNYKIYPCCGVFSTAMDCFMHVIRENQMQPDSIDRITVFVELENFGVEPIWKNTEIKSSVDAQFSAPYNFAVAAHGVKPGPDWQALDIMRSPAVLELMKKITVSPHPDFEKHAAAAAKLGGVEVIARGKIFKEERRHAKGSPSPKEFRLTDDELVEKFRDQALRILPINKVNRAVDKIMGLELEKDVSEVTENLTL
jgi:2-methylcitrate dehydratase PrpD